MSTASTFRDCKFFLHNLQCVGCEFDEILISPEFFEVLAPLEDGFITADWVFD